MLSPSPIKNCVGHLECPGHATVAFTLDTYSHVPGLQEAAAKTFDDNLKIIAQ